MTEYRHKTGTVTTWRAVEPVIRAGQMGLLGKRRKPPTGDVGGFRNAVYQQ